MNKLLRTILTGIATTAIGSVLVATTATPAHAGGCAGTVCGGVTNSSNSNATIPVTTDWTAPQGDFTSTSSMNYTPLDVGQTKGGHFSGVDVDGFFTSTGCTVYGISGFKKDGDGGRNRFIGGTGTTTGTLRSNLWIKIATDEQVTVRIVC